MRMGWTWCVIAGWLGGCGPMIVPDEATESEAASGEASTTTPPGGTTAPPPPPGTTAPPPPPGTTSLPDDTTGGDEPMTSLIFLPRIDNGSSEFECDLWDQDCPRGEKCMPWANDGGSSWNATRCSPVDRDPGAPGEPCTVEGSGVSGIDSCELGAMCWDVDPETNTGTCVALCVGSREAPMCEDPGSSCIINGDGTLIICLPVCDPLLQDCSAGEGCYPTDHRWLCAPDSSEPDAGDYGDPCEYVNGCDPGYVCMEAAAVPPGQPCEGTVACCSAICAVSDGDVQCEGAAEGQTCQPWYEEGQAPAGYEDVGVCALPM